MPTIQRRAIAVLLISLIAAIFLWRPLIGGEVFLPLDALLHLHPWRYSYERVPVNNHISTDSIRQIYPRRLLTNTIVHQGAWPLWNSTILSGVPLFDDGQIAFFYPPNLIFLIVPLDKAFGIYAWIQLIIAGVGSYAFARRIGLNTGPALLAGVCYMFSGHMLTYVPFPELSGATAMLPWCFWGIERALSSSAWRSWAVAAAMLGIVVLAQIQLAFYTYVATGSYALFRIVQRDEGRTMTRLRLLIGLALAYALGIGLSAVQLLPAIALSTQGQRSDIGFMLAPPEEYFSSMLRLVFPALGGFERVGPPPAWGPPVLQVPYPYVGLTPLALTIIGLAIARHRLAAFFGVVAVASFALAVRTPLLYIFIALIPPYRQFEDHTRWYMVWGFAVAILAAIAAQRLYAPGGAWENAPSRSDRRARLPAARLLLLIVGVFIVGWSLHHLALFTPQSRAGHYLSVIRSQQLLPLLIFGSIGLISLALLRFYRRNPAIAFAPVIAVAAVDMWWYGAGFNTSVSPSIAQPTTDLTRELIGYPRDLQLFQVLYPPTRQIAFLQSQPRPFRIHGGDYDALPPNIASAYGLEDVRGYHSLYPARYNRLVRLIDGKDYRRTSEGNVSLRAFLTSAYERPRLLDMLNVRYIIFPPGSQTAARYPGLELVHESDEGRIYYNPNALPRAWLVYRVETIPDDEAQLDYMARPDFDPATVVVVPTSVPTTGPAPTAPDPTPAVTYTPNTVIVTAAPSAPAILVLADAWYEGWEVLVNGAPAPILRVNYALRGVWLPPGSHTVEFVYRPRPFLIGGLISLATLVVLAIGAIARR
ncbi:MAG: YfhO family protein [Roseiflexus sp.]